MSNPFHDLFGVGKSNIDHQIDIVDEQIQAARNDDNFSDKHKAEEIKKLELVKASVPRVEHAHDRARARLFMAHTFVRAAH